MACSDKCLPNNLARLFSRHLPRSFETKPCLLVNIADELQSSSQFFRRFTIPLDPLDVHSEVLTDDLEPKLRPWIDPCRILRICRDINHIL